MSPSDELIMLAVVVGGAVALGVAAILFLALRRSRRSQSLLQTMINGMTRGVAAFEEGRLVAWNDRLVDLLQIPAGLAKLGTPISRFEKTAANGLLSDLSVQIEAARLSKQTIKIERTRSDGAVIALFFSPPADGIAAFEAADVTLRRQHERFLQNAQKMDALGKMTGGIAHDFNNLLTVVLMNLDVMRQDSMVMQKFGRRVELMSAASQKGSALVRQLLAYARKQPLDPEVLDLRDLMPALADLIQRTIGEDIEVETNVAKELWAIIVDPAQFESAVLNLALNARDAMPDGGKLVLELTNATLGDSDAGLHAEVNGGDYVMFAVSDTGCGMSSDVMARAFDPFFTTKSDGEGTGLGLSMVYGFVKQTGGHIKISSEVGQGSTFKLYFPRCRQNAIDSEPPRQLATPTGTETILIVEDDERLRVTTDGVLKDLGYETLQATNGQSALALLERGAPVDLLFTDIVLSGSVNGLKLAAAAREIQPKIKVLYTSGYTEKAEQHSCQLDTTVGLLNKPYRIEDLAMKLRVLLAAPLV